VLVREQLRDAPGPLEPPTVEALDAGVIEEARRRQRRQRLIAASAVLAAALAAAVVLGSSGAGHSAPARGPVRLVSSPTWLTGSPLRGATHLRLVASENAGPASIVDVDTGIVERLPQLHVPRGPGTAGSALYPLMLVPGGALAVVNHQPCQHCAITQDDFLIKAGGSVRQIASRHFPALQGTTETAYVPGSTSEWVLTWPRHGHCTLRLAPSTHPAIIVPCGDLGAAFPTGVALWTDGDRRSVLVNPLTGAVTGALNTAYGYDLIGHGLAIEGTRTPSASPTSLSLVNLASGNRLRLGWPSTLRFGYQVYPEPHGPLVAVEFADPAYPPPPHETVNQAADIWLLNTRTGSFKHVPGFPILEGLKVSGVAWTTDDQLVAVALGGGRTTVAVWRPGQHALAVRTLPALNGYSAFVPLVNR
jgi:hypothetical protein